MKRIEVLVFEGCPNVDTTVSRARDAAAAVNVSVDIDVVQVRNHEEAIQTRFLGSPTVRVDGIDVDPSAMARVDFGMQCRVYSVHGRLEGAPPVPWIEAMLRGTTPADTPPDAAAGESSCCTDPH